MEYKIMNSKHIKPMLWAMVLLDLAVMPALADAPYEQYHVIHDDIAKGVLENTIGILTINSGKNNELKTYVQTGAIFSYHKTLLVKEETRPISNFGYGYRATFKEDEYEHFFGSLEENTKANIGYPEGDGITVALSDLSTDQIRELGKKKFALLIKRFQAAHPHVENYRFPIVERQENYVRLVYDPVENLQAWINLQELGGFHHNLLIIDTLVAKQSSYDFVDIFHFTQNGKRKVYQQPDQNAAFAVISKNARQFRWLKIIDQKAGFIQVGTIRYLNDQPKVDPIGWVRIRDDEKRLMLWIVSVDNC
jgi:hypothetical protein